MFRLTTPPRLWTRLGNNPERLEISEPIVGKIVSDVPTDSSSQFDNVVERAIVKILLQEDAITAQEEGESNADFEARVLDSVTGQVDKLELRPLTNGGYTFGEPGAFETEQLPFFRVKTRFGKEEWTPALYAMQVVGARTGEFVRDPPVTGEPTGDTTTLAFGDRTFINLRPGQLPRNFSLRALFALGGKKAMLASVIRACPNNYGPPETPVLDYIGKLERGEIELDDVRDEGVQRAIWAELIVRDGALLADRMLNAGLAGLGNLLADLFDDLVKFEGAELRRGRAEQRKIKELSTTIDPGIAADFKLDPEDINEQGLRALQAADASDFAAELVSITKSLRFVYSATMQRLGVRNEVLLAIPDQVERITLTLLRFIKARSLAGTLKAELKKLIQVSVQSSSGELLDGQVFPYSYCAITAKHLTESGTAMMGWSEANRQAYLDDRENAVFVANGLNQTGTDVLRDLIFFQFAAEAADVAGDVLSAVGQAVKTASILSEVADTTKHGLNLVTFAAPIGFVYSDLPKLVDAGVHAAYGLPAGGGASALPVPQDLAARYSTDRFTAEPPAPPLLTLDAPVFALSSALFNDDIGSALDLFAGDSPDSLVAQIESARSKARGFQMSLIAADPDTATSEAALALEAALREQVDVAKLQQELLAALSEFFVNVLTLEYTGTHDFAYRAERGRVMNLVNVVAQATSNLDFAFQEAASKAFGTTFLPAVATDGLRIVSQSSGGSLVTASPETFDVSARVRNVSTQTVDNITARLLLLSRTGQTTVVGSADINIGSLTADDSLLGSGSDEQIVTWAVVYAGPLEDETIDLEVEILEGDQPPVGFVALGANRRTTIDPDLTDADLDRMPDLWETAHGLDVTKDDSMDDLEGDGLVNVAELDWGTLPGDEDSDNDGLLDGEEVTGGLAAETTDPLDDDSDGDGLLDGVDPAPNDPRTEGGALSLGAATGDLAEPSVSLSKHSVILSNAQRFAVVNVTNPAGGLMEWAVEPGVNPAFVTTQPPAGEISTRDFLIVTAPATFDFSAEGEVTVELHIRDMSGAIPDVAMLRATVTPVAPTNELCGHASGTGADESISAVDALAALRGAVKLGQCPLCRCDADGSGTLQASDALIILRLAVQLDGPLDCPPC